jgi:hypothetical protein
MNRNAVFERVVVFCLIAAALYGASYQQYRHFDYDDSRGLSDSHSYVAMAQGSWDVSPVRRFRFIIPVVAGFVCRLLNRCDVNGLILIFYIINFSVIVATAMLFYELLRLLGFKGLLPIVGVLLFTSSRITVISTAAPMVDSLYCLSVVVVSYLLLERRFRLLLALFPCLVLAKETVIPLLFLPLICREFRGRRVWGLWAISFAVSLVTFNVTRSVIGLSPVAGTVLTGSFDRVVAAHLRQLLPNAARLLSPSGLHDFQNGFSLLLPMAAVGFYINNRHRAYEIPSFAFALLLLAFGFELLSGGRMFFCTAYVVIIPYALVLVAHIMQKQSRNDGLMSASANTDGH